MRLLTLAEEFQAKLEAGEVKHRADLARHYVMSRARVTQLMCLLDLHPDIKRFVHSLGRGVAPRYVTERKLRPLSQLPKRQQLAEAKRLFPTFMEQASSFET